uniref:Uncharacterized protein n=1 Tax=Rhipicephalus microplus TaxID=6941 RepID=A0A6M2DAQ0_RHIMP
MLYPATIIHTFFLCVCPTSGLVNKFKKYLKNVACNGHFFQGAHLYALAVINSLHFFVLLKVFKQMKQMQRCTPLMVLVLVCRTRHPWGHKDEEP